MADCGQSKATLLLLAILIFVAGYMAGAFSVTDQAQAARTQMFPSGEWAVAIPEGGAALLRTRSGQYLIVHTDGRAVPVHSKGF